MKKTKQTNVTPLKTFLTCIFALFLIAGISACDSRQQTTEAPAVAEVAPAPAPAPAAAPPASIVAPVGTRLFVTMDSELDTRKHGTGHKFSATLDSNLVIDGQTLAAKGSRVYGQTTNAKKGGFIAGRSEIDLQLTDILINDVPNTIVTSGIKAITENKAKSTVKTTGVGAAVGGIAGGSKGAKTGAAVGLGLSALSGGNAINIPQGTLLEFTLASELTYKP
jgi:hypothetical protein